MPRDAAPVVRARTTEDLDACVDALWAVHAVDGYPMNWPADPRRWLSPDRLLRAWVAEAPGAGIAGHVAIQSVTEPAALGEVSRLFVVPAARRRGVAEALVRRAADWARARELPLVLNVVDEGRSAAVAFYEAGGWRYTHSSVADWRAADGSAVRLRHYRLEG